MSPSKNHQPTQIILMIVGALSFAICQSRNTLAWSWQTPQLRQKLRRPTRTSVSYKTVDPIVEKEQISTSTSNPGDGEDDTVDEYGIIGQDDIFEEENIVEEDKISKLSRSFLGSLFLRQEDADRDRNVDVFGRSLVNETETEEEASSPFSFAQKLMNLKHQEEDNREKATGYHRSESKDDSRDDMTFVQKISAGLQKDQVSKNDVRVASCCPRELLTFIATHITC